MGSRRLVGNAETGGRSANGAASGMGPIVTIANGKVFASSVPKIRIIKCKEKRRHCIVDCSGWTVNCLGS